MDKVLVLIGQSLKKFKACDWLKTYIIMNFLIMMQVLRNSTIIVHFYKKLIMKDCTALSYIFFLLKKYRPKFGAVFQMS